MASIYVFDPDTAEYLGEVDAYTSCVLERSWQGVGDCQIVMDTRCAGAELLQVGRVITIGNAWHKAAILTAERLDGARGSHRRTLTGVELKGIARLRITVPPTAQEDPDALGYDRVIGAGEEVLRHYADRHMVNPTSEYRKIPLLELEPAADPPRGKETPWQTRYENLQDVLSDIAEYCDIGWNVAMDYPRRRWLLTVSEGRDLTMGNAQAPSGGGEAPEGRGRPEGDPQAGTPARQSRDGAETFVAFEEDFRNLTTSSYTYDRGGYTNALYLGGAGEDENRLVIVRYVDEEHELLEEPLSGLARAEEMIDVGNVELPDEAEYEGLHKYVSGFSPLRTLTAQISPAGPFVYEADWDLGDKVTVQVRDAAVGLSVRMDARVLTVEETYERGGQSLRVTFGKEEPTIGQALRQAQRQTVR